MMLLLGILVYMAGGVEAQKTIADNKAKKQPTAAEKTRPAAAKGENASTEITNLSDTSAWNAYLNNPTSARTFFVADSTVRTLNRRAYGIDTETSLQDVIGVNKRRFGIANGRFIFRTSNTTTSGANTGSGAVGTGSTPAALGALGPGMGVNGTSPKVGTGMTTIPATIVPSDVNTRVVPYKPPVNKNNP